MATWGLAEMYFCSAFSEKYLRDAISQDECRATLREALSKFDQGHLVAAHSMCDEVSHRSSLAIVLSALFSKKGETKNEFEQRHIRYLRRAAELENPLALYSLATYHESGELVQCSKRDAERYYMLASELGMPLACHAYGIMLYYGHKTETITIDKQKALNLLRFAADRGVDESCEFLQYLHTDT